MSQEEFDTAIRAYDLAHQHVAEAIARDDLELARAEIDDILRDVKSGAYGPLASAVMPPLDNYLDRGLTAGEVAWSYLYELPQFVLWSFPIAALVAAVFTVHGMTVNREIVAAKAGGISFHRLLVPVFALGLLLTGGALWLADIVPRGNRIAAEIRQEEDTRQSWRTNFVYQTEDGRSLAVRRLAVSEKRMHGVVMQKGDPIEERPVTHMVASVGHYSEDRGWILQNGHLRRIQPGGEELTWRFDELVAPGLTEKPEELLEEPRDDELMTYEEMGRLADIIRRSGGDPQKLLVEREQKLAIPVATLVIILFGAPLATSSQRGGAAFGIGISLGSTILYLVLFKVLGAVGESGALSPVAAAWTPNAIFLLAGLVLLARVRT